MDMYTVILSSPSQTIWQFNSNYTIQLLENNQLQITTKYIVIKNAFLINSYDFTSSTLTSVNINNTVLEITSFTNLLKYIYEQINDGVKIISRSKLSMKTVDTNNPNFTYFENLGIGYQLDTTNNYVGEICNQASINKMSINLNITLSNGTIINIVL